MWAGSHPEFIEGWRRPWPCFDKLNMTACAQIKSLPSAINKSGLKFIAFCFSAIGKGKIPGCSSSAQCLTPAISEGEGVRTLSLSHRRGTESEALQGEAFAKSKFSVIDRYGMRLFSANLNLLLILS